MKFQAERADGIPLVTGYGPGWLAVDGEKRHSSTLINTLGLLQDWDCPSFSALNSTHLEALAALCQEHGIEVLLLGSGQQLRFPPMQWLRPLVQQRIGLETMDTAAALRTYNVLATEGRKVLAALILE